MMRQCQLESCGKWFEIKGSSDKYCPGECQREGKRIRNRLAKANANHDVRVPVADRSHCHNPSDIMHAPADQAARIIDRILSGRDVFVGVR